MPTLRMMWNTDNGHLSCHWVDIRDRPERGPLSPLSAPENTSRCRQRMQTAFVGGRDSKPHPPPLLSAACH